MTTLASDRPHLGLPLKIWLGLVFLGSLWVAYRLGMQIEDLVSHRDPRWQGDLRWALPTLMGTSVGQAASALLLFARLRSGLYLLIVCAAAALTVNLMIGVPLGAMAISLIGVGITIVLVRQAWHAMR